MAELLAEKKRMREQLDKEMADLEARLRGSAGDAHHLPEPLDFAGRPDPSSPFEVTAAAVQLAPATAAPRPGDDDDDDDECDLEQRRPSQVERMSSFGRLSSSALPAHCTISKTDIRLETMVGRGSFGVVWKALHVSRNVQVAVKLFLNEDVEREVITLAQVRQHPNVLTFIGVIFEVDDPHKEPQVEPPPPQTPSPRQAGP
jgi:hypothetical protein